MLPLCLQNVCECIKWLWEFTNPNLLPLCLQEVCESIKWQWEFTNANMFIFREYVNPSNGKGNSLILICCHCVFSKYVNPLNDNNDPNFTNVTVIYFQQQLVCNCQLIPNNNSLTVTCLCLYSACMWFNFIFTNLHHSLIQICPSLSSVSM